MIAFYSWSLLQGILTIINYQLIVVTQHQCAIFTAEVHSPTLAIAEEFAIIAWL